MRRLLPRLCAASVTFLAGVLLAAFWPPAGGFLRDLSWGSLLTLLSVLPGTVWCLAACACGGAKKVPGARLFTLLLLAGVGLLMVGVAAAAFDLFGAFPR